MPKTCCSSLYSLRPFLLTCAVVAAALSACGQADLSFAGGDGDAGADEAALYDTPGLSFTGTCGYGKNGNMALVLGASNKVMISAQSSAPYSITLNGNAQYCGNATLRNITSFAISVQGGGVGTSEEIVLDYTNGFFGMKGGGAMSGTYWDTGGQNGGADADTLQIIMPRLGNSNVTVGATGIHLVGTYLVDIAFLNSHNPNTVQVSYIGGTNRFNGMGDALVGGPSQSHLVVNGGPGNENFYTGTGNMNDLYSGGDGNDTIFIGPNAGTGHMILDGGNGFDTVSFASRTLPVYLRIGAGFASGDIAATEQHNITVSVESVVGGNGNDILQGSVAGMNTILYGGPGNDNFYQGSVADSNDTMWGGPGLDTVNYGDRTCDMVVNLDNNPNDGCRSTTGEADNVKLDVENVITGTGSDTIIGNNNDNVINAGGGAGINHVWGMGGDDTFMQDSNATDIISGGTGQDTVSYENRGPYNITATLDGISASGQIEGGEGDIIGTDVENLTGTKGNATNVLVGNSGPNVISSPGSGTNTIDCQGGQDIAIHGTNISNCEITFP